MRVEALLVKYEQRQVAAGGGVDDGAGANKESEQYLEISTEEREEGEEREKSKEREMSEEEEDMAKFWATTSMTGETNEVKDVTKGVVKDSVAMTNERTSNEKVLDKQSTAANDIDNAAMDEGDHGEKMLRSGDGSTMLPDLSTIEKSKNIMREREEGEEGMYIRYFQAQALQSSSYMYNDWGVVHGRVKQYMSLLSWYYDQHYSRYSELKKKERTLSGYMSGACVIIDR